MFVQIRDFPDYMVDENGAVVSLKRGKWRTLRQGLNIHGYATVGLCNNNKAKTFTVHKIVAETLLGKRPEGYQVNHKNGIKTDNRVENLEYCTPSQNRLHAWATGLHIASEAHRESARRQGKASAGERHGHSKLSDSKIEEIKALKGTLLQREIAAKFGISQSHVSEILNNKKRKVSVTSEVIV